MSLASDEATQPNGSGTNANRAGGNGTQTKKRNRALLSCTTCHSRRVKCNRKQPCEACINFGCADMCAFASVPTKQDKKKRKSIDQGLERVASSSQESDTSPPHSDLVMIPASSVSQSSLPPPPPAPAPLSEINNYPFTSSAESNQDFPLTSFFAFVERFQQHTQNANQQNPQSAYPVEFITAITRAKSDLPVLQRVKLLILFFMEHLEWAIEAADYDEMDSWLLSFLNKICQKSLTSDRLIKGDATRLCLVMTILASSIQVTNEALLKIQFLDSNPATFTQQNMTRKVVKDTYESHIRNLLDIATQQDGASVNLVRSSIIYCYFLKNEGRHCESNNQPFGKSISQIVQQTNLHIDPSPSLSEYERNSQRKLFWAFYGFDRMTAAHHGYPILIKDDMITTKEPIEETWAPKLGRRVHLTSIFRSRLSRIGGRLATLLNKDSLNVDSVQMIEKQLQAWENSLPLELQPQLSELPANLYQLRTFDLQRRLLLVIYYSIRGSLHRLCFFPTDTIDMKQVQKSRKVCVNSAMEMIKVQEGFRLLLVSEHNLRFFFVPYFMLESAITLVLTTLIDVGNLPPGSDTPEEIVQYMKWARRALDLLISLPSDFPPAIQGARLLSRVLTKASQILELHAQRKLTSVESSSAIREVLCDDTGARMPIPLHDHIRNKNQTVAPPESSTSAGQNARTPASFTTSSSLSDFSTSLNQPSDFLSSSSPSLVQSSNSNSMQGSFSSLGTKSSSSSYLTMAPTPSAAPDLLSEPTYADLGLDFFDTMANALSNPFSGEIDPLLLQQQQQEQIQPSPVHQQQSFQQQMLQLQPPGLHNNNHTGLDDQMDMWLASLQTY